MFPEQIIVEYVKTHTHIYLSIIIPLFPSLPLSCPPICLLNTYTLYIQLSCTPNGALKYRGPAQPALAVESDLHSLLFVGRLPSQAMSCRWRSSSPDCPSPDSAGTRANPAGCRGRPAAEMPSGPCRKRLGRHLFPPLRASVATLLPLCPTLVYGSGSKGSSDKHGPPGLQESQEASCRQAGSWLCLPA